MMHSARQKPAHINSSGPERWYKQLLQPPRNEHQGEERSASTHNLLPQALDTALTIRVFGDTCSLSLSPVVTSGTLTHSPSLSPVKVFKIFLFSPVRVFESSLLPLLSYRFFSFTIQVLSLLAVVGAATAMPQEYGLKVRNTSLLCHPHGGHHE